MISIGLAVNVMPTSRWDFSYYFPEILNTVLHHSFRTLISILQLLYVKWKFLLLYLIWGFILNFTHCCFNAVCLDNKFNYHNFSLQISVWLGLIKPSILSIFSVTKIIINLQNLKCLEYSFSEALKARHYSAY